MTRFVLALALIGAGPEGEAPGPGVVVTQADESAFPAITVYFEVRGDDGGLVRDAVADEFRVEEGGRSRPIDRFEAPVTLVRKPTTIVLVVDRSGSMGEDDKMPALRRAVATFLDGLPEGSTVAMLAFASDLRRACPFTDDLDRVRVAVDSLEPRGATRYYDAVAQALEWLSDRPGRRAVLALTDGQDTDSRLSIDDAIEAGRRLGVPVHTLGLGRGDAIEPEALDRLAEGTRGQSYRADDADSLRAIYQELAERLGATYSLTYTTDRPVADGTLRPIRIAYARSSSSGEASVFIPGMVVASPGWSPLFLVLIAILSALAFLPGRLARRLKA